jgi:pimeloyl-ACP methyl ester carboxylesterase
MHRFHRLVWALCWLVGVGFVLGACGYVREPAQGPVSDLVAPQPVWPSNYTNFKPLRIDIPLQLFDDKPGEPKWMLSMVGDPVGQGWISWDGNVTQPPSSHDAFVFNYSAWRSEPAAMAIAHSAERFEAMKERGEFTLGFLRWMPTSGEPKGLVVHQWGMGGQRYEQGIVDTLRRSGWAVLAYNGFAWKPEEVRGTSLSTVPDADLSGSDDASRRRAAERAAVLAARNLDNIVGQYAVGVEAALLHVRRRFPATADKPLVLIGCSLGSLMTPAVAMRLGDQVRACVLVGSGVNMLALGGKRWQDGAYSSVRRGRSDAVAVPAAERKHMLDEYLRHSTLDPYNAAPALRRVPTLMLHARWDAIVPASGGRTLWERAGRPERWTGNFGHLWMFLTLDDMADDIVAWIEQTVTPPVAATGD